MSVWNTSPIELRGGREGLAIEGFGPSTSASRASRPVPGKAAAKLANSMLREPCFARLSELAGAKILIAGAERASA
jgi:hypothetical protein